MASISGSEASPRLLVVAGIVWCGDRLIVQRRSPRATHGAGKLEFPGGKVERGENPADALVRELTEEWGPSAAQLRVGRIAEVLHHVYPPPGPEVVLLLFHVDAMAWQGRDWHAELELEAGAEVVDYAHAELPAEDFLEADRHLVAALRDGRLRPELGAPLVEG